MGNEEEQFRGGRSRDLRVLIARRRKEASKKCVYKFVHVHIVS